MVTAAIGIFCFFGGTLFGMITTALMTNSKINSIYDDAGRLQDFKKDKSEEQ